MAGSFLDVKWQSKEVVGFVKRVEREQVIKTVASLKYKW